MAGLTEASYSNNKATTMKANLKGLSGIKGLLLRHGEKVGIAIVGVLAAMFVYASIGRPRLSDEHQPEVLQQRITQTRSTVDQRTWQDAVAQNPENVRIGRPLEKTNFNVPPELYVPESKVTWDPAVIKSTVPRTDPVLLAAAGVYATGGTGRFAFMDESVRNQRALEAQKKADIQAAEQQRQQQQQLQNQNQNQGGYGEGRGGRGEEFGPGGMAYAVDPDHPDRRPVEYTMTRMTGPQLMGDERVDHMHWACVVAKVPIKEQIKLYRDAFENARGGYNPDQGDFPTYRGYEVERAEVVAGKELQWQQVHVHDAQASRKDVGPIMVYSVLEKLYKIIAKEWPGQPIEPIDPRYLDPERVLVYPLPPLVGREWGAEITHPDIPLNPPPMEEVAPVEEQPLAAEGEDEGAGLFQRDPASQGFGGATGGGMRGGYGGEFGGRSMYGGEFGGRGGYGRGGYGGEFGGMGRGGYGMGRGEEGGGYGGGYATMSLGSGANMAALPPGVTDWLVRFFDFTVEPGKRYKYRVRLILSDPNRNPALQENALDSAVLTRIREAKKKNKKAPPVRYADWSEPSPIVGIPLAGNVQVAEASAANPKLFSSEPSAKLLVRAIDAIEGKPTEAALEQEFNRGYVANLMDKDAEVLTTDGKFIDPVESFDFRTGVTVLDMRGGESISRDYKTPARVLLMGPSGQLFIRNELDDLPDVEYHREIFKKDRRNRGRGGEGEMYDTYGPGGEGGGYGGEFGGRGGFER